MGLSLIISVLIGGTLEGYNIKTKTETMIGEKKHTFRRISASLWASLLLLYVLLETSRISFSYWESA